MNQNGRTLASPMCGRAAMTLAVALSLTGCLSGPDVPDTLLNLTAQASAAAGSGSAGSLATAIAVIEPEAPQRLDVKRVPVRIDQAQVAYLENSLWVEKPARLFRQLLAETIRAEGRWLVIDAIDRQYSARTRLTGQLLDMGYDAAGRSAVVRFEAVLEGPEGALATRRFESSVSGIAPVSGEIGPALNDAANDVARQVTRWIGEQPLSPAP